MRRPYRKHLVLIEKNYIPVKNWRRNNPNFFTNHLGVPTSEQIGIILIQNGYERTETDSEVLYSKKK
jgi:hypothetical protein